MDLFLHRRRVLEDLDELRDARVGAFVVARHKLDGPGVVLVAGQCQGLGGIKGFGSQDAEGRQRLIEAINYVRDEFSKIIVITHLEELKDAFSARIEISKEANGSQVRVVAA